MKILVLLLMCFSIHSFGAVIIIKNQPLPLIYKNELYYLPLSFSISPGTTNLYITMDDIKKVCFINKARPGLLEQTSEINIVVNGVKTGWNCFPYRTVLLRARP